jgi:hypothetical protein
MTAVHITALLGTGLAAGFASGLLGVGGGWIMAPVQYWVYLEMGIPSDVALRVAFGTNLLVFLPTAASSAWGHQRRGAVWWKAAMVLGGFAFFGALGGATAAAYISASVLKTIFGAIMPAIAIGMLVGQPPPTAEKPRDNVWLWIACALPVSFMAALTGLGGGLFMLPIMVLVFKFKMHLAVGTSAAMMMMTCLGGLVGYMVYGAGVADIPSPSIGYIYLWAWLCLVTGSIAAVPLGVRAAHRLPAKQLGWVFSAIVLYVGLKMLGLFSWL